MKVRLISDDRSLYAICRKVLVKRQSVKWDLAVVSNNPGPDADLYIWDYEADTSLQGLDRVASKINIFVVERENLPALRSHFDQPPVWTILKPVNPLLLEGYLADYCAGRMHGGDLSTGLQGVKKDRDDILQALLECNLLLQEMDQKRNGMVVHSYRELRSPLMASLGYCRLLLDQQLGSLNAEQQKVIQRMQQSMQRLFRLSTSMLQSALGPDVRLQSRFQVGDIEDCVERAVAEVVPFADARNLVIQREITPPAKPFQFDQEQVIQVLASLLDNAVRSTPRGGQITIRALPVFWDRRARNLAEGGPETDRRMRQNVETNSYRIEVHDPGPSFRQAALDRIPEAGSVDPMASKGAQPFVYGLAMCQQVVDSHRGRILVDGDENGYFAIELPYNQPVEPAKNAAPIMSGNREVPVEVKV